MMENLSLEKVKVLNFPLSGFKAPLGTMHGQLTLTDTVSISFQRTSVKPGERQAMSVFFLQNSSSLWLINKEIQKN